MALKKPPSIARALLVGWTDVKPYKAGTFSPDGGGEKIPFGSGQGFRVALAHDEHDFTVMKVRGRDKDAAEVANMFRVMEAVTAAGVWSHVEVSYYENQGQFELIGVQLLERAEIAK